MAEEAPRDGNFVPTALFQIDGEARGQLMAGQIDQATGRILVDNTAGSGTVTSVSVATANGFAGTVANPTTTPAITLSTTVTGVLYGNGTSVAAATGGQLPVMTSTVGGAVPTPPNNTTTFLRGDGTFAAPAGGGTVTSVSFTGGLISVATATTTPALTVAGTSGGIPYFSSASTWATSAALAANAIVIGGGAGAAPATTTTGTGVLTALGINVGSAGAFVTFNGALGTPSSGTLTNCTGLPVGSITGLGTGVATALAVNVGSAGAFVTFNGALGTPSSGTVTNLTGTASININGTVGGTTPTTATFTTATINTGITLAENASIALDPAGSADGKYTGITVTGVAGYTQAFGDLVYLAVADSRWELADADAASTAGPVMLAMVVVAGTDGNACTLLLQGIIRADAKFPTMTVGATQYVGETAGAIQGTIPTGADNIIRTVGYALTADELYFNPSTDWQITVA
jgi:hypothetical protein